jgi:glycosyltransferase involved in cell wall biosynthesis
VSPRVHQLLSGAGPFDAITTEALGYRDTLAARGIEGEVFASSMDPAIGGRVRNMAELDRQRRDDDLLVVHVSAYARELERALDLPNRRLLLYHNITPSRFLWAHDPYVAMVCALGRDRLRRYAGRVDGAVAASEFSARDLAAAGFDGARGELNLYRADRARLGAPAPAHDGDPDAPMVLFVGRLSHNKRQDRIIKAFALYRREHAPGARLVLAGSAGRGTYGEFLAGLADELGVADAVTLTGPISQEELNAHYAAADVFLCLSEHEGFCLPLLEAMHHGVPIVAASRASVPEVAGDAGVMLDDASLPVVAEALDVVVRDGALRAELRSRGLRRLETQFSPERHEAALSRIITPLI